MIAKISLSFIATVLFGTHNAQAQIYQPSNRIPVADNTLGTQVTGTNNNFIINGGLTRGSSIFHSFQDFSVPTGGNATFTLGAGTQAVVSRVTGNLSSDINGIVNTQGANFFLINPNGVVFGSNAQLNVGSSFVTTTANNATLSDANGTAYTFGTSNLNDAPLLSISPNVGLNVSRLNFLANSAPITNFANLRTNNANQYVGLVGGDVTLDAGIGSGNIAAPGGRVDIGGLRSAGTANITAQGFDYRDDLPSATSGGFVRSDLTLIDGARVDVTTNQPVGRTNPFFFQNATSLGSVINIDTRNVRIFNRERITPTVIRFKEPNARTEEAPTTTTTENNPLPRARRIGLRPRDSSLVAQACESGNSKLVITGRGGVPSNANDSLGSDVVWQDPRTTNSLAATTKNIEPVLPPPAIGWAMNNQGRIALLAAGSGEAAIAPKVSCPPQKI
jgi:filamentous hemagglutinin family protein